MEVAWGGAPQLGQLVVAMVRGGNQKPGGRVSFEGSYEREEKGEERDEWNGRRRN